MSAGGSRGGLFAALALVFVTALAVRAWPASRTHHPTPDGVEYLAAAYELAEGRGFRLPLRAFHVMRGAGPWPVDHAAELERAPLWPMLLAPLWRFSGAAAPIRAQQLSCLLAALCALLAAKLCAQLSRQEGETERSAARGALMAGLFVGLHPALFYCSLRALSEPLELALLLAALCAAMRPSLDPRAAIISGLCSGALVLARPDGALLGAGLGLAIGLRDRRLAVLFAASLFVACAPVLTLNVLRHGRIFPAQRFLFEVASCHELQWGFGQGAAELRFEDLLRGASGNALAYARALFEPRKSSLLLLVLILAAARCRAPGYRARAGLLIFALLLLAARVAVWSAQDPTRYPLPALVLLAVVAAAELARLTVGGRWLFALTLLLILLGPGARALNRQQTGPAEASAWRNRDLAELSARLPEVAVVAATNPWALWLVTRRRAVLLPTRLDPRPLEGFLAAYGVTHVLITPGAAHPGVEEPMAYAATLAARGWSRMSLERSELLTAPK